VPALWIVVVLGIVEGLTEFLPVSSTGHLVLVGHALGFRAPLANTFEVFIQSGAMLAVVGLHHRRFLAILRPAPERGFGGARALGLLAATTAPALLAGYLLRDAVHGGMQPLPVAVGLAAGGVGLLLLERLRGNRGERTIDDLTGAMAWGIGLFQCLALWPGVSRAGATIAGGMLLGLTRTAAAEWSFVAAVPVIAAASLYELWSARADLAAEHVPTFAVGFAVSAIAAAVAIRGFTALLQRTTLEPFAWYRLVLAAAIVVALVI
jgi:undecaprenyl-diphosphatase